MRRGRLRELGERLAHYREAQRLTRGILAESVGLSEEKLAQIECGRANPLYATVLRIIDQLGAATWDFFESGVPRVLREIVVRYPNEPWLLVAGALQPFVLVWDTEQFRAGDRVRLVETLDGEDTGSAVMLDITSVLYGNSVSVAPGVVVLGVERTRQVWVVPRSDNRGF